MRPMTFVWCCLLLMSISDAGATQYYVDGSIGTSGTGLSWGEAKKTIAEAMALATNGDEVWVRAGTYTADSTNSLVVMKSEVDVHGGFAGNETELSESDPAANPTILDGARTSWRVVRADHVSSAVLGGFIIERGNSPYTQAATYGRGAGIYLYYSNAITISDCTIRCNAGRNGGGIYSNYSSPTIDHCAIYNNRVTSYGGGIYLTNGTGTITNCTVAGNMAALFGAGIDIGSGASSTVVMDCVISANYAYGSTGGGGGFVGACILVNSLVTGNRAAYGGGIFGGSGQYLFCTIDGNTANYGGGYYCSGGDAEPVVGTLIDCIFSHNQGSGIYDAAVPLLSYSLFHDNTPADFANSLGNAITGTANIEAFCGRSIYSRDGDPSFDVAACASGTWSAAPVFDSATSTTLLTCSAAGLQADALARKLINPNLTANPQCYVMSNTQTTITVAGDATALCAIGDAWRIMNYDLASDSAAIDWGCAIDGVGSDINGVSRPQDIAGVGYDGTGQGYDIGAYEYLVSISSIVWLQFSWSGVEIGTEALPFNTLDEALNGVTTGGTIIIKHGSSGVLAKRITKNVRIEASGGTARLGAN